MSWEHPVWKVPSLEDAEAVLRVRPDFVPADVPVHLRLKAAWQRLEEKRRERITLSQERPLSHGWEPSIWWVADALLGLDWVLPPHLPADFAPRMRRALLGRNRPVKILQINGGNRGGKTMYTLKRSLQCMFQFPRAKLWLFHTDGDNSRTMHQNELWPLIPGELKPKRQLKTETTYIAWKQATGFSEQQFIVPNGSQCEFRTYEQEKDKIEGGNLGAGQPVKLTGERFEECLGWVTSEHVPADWIDTLGLRLATRGAHGIVEFTPTNGYSPAVKLFQHGMRVVRWSTAWLLPKVPGVEPDVERQMAGEDCCAWIEEQPLTPALSPQAGERVTANGRPLTPALSPQAVERESMFEKVPRVAVCADPTRACLWIHSSDNGFGGAREVWAEIAHKHTAFKRERFYGVADKEQAGAFPLFDEAVHGVDVLPVFEQEIRETTDLH